MDGRMNESSTFSKEERPNEALFSAPCERAGQLQTMRGMSRFWRSLYLCLSSPAVSIRRSAGCWLRMQSRAPSKSGRAHAWAKPGTKKIKAHASLFEQA